MIDAAVLTDIRTQLQAALRTVDIQHGDLIEAARLHRGGMLEGRSATARDRVMRGHLRRARQQGANPQHSGNVGVHAKCGEWIRMACRDEGIDFNI